MTRPVRSTPLPIPQLQGRGSLSPYDGKSVLTSGVITAVQRLERDPGFFLQDPAGDNDAATSDGIFVSTAKLSDSAREAFQPGKQVTVSGQVSEEYGLTQILAGATGVKPIKDAKRLSREQLPAPTELALPASRAAASTYLEAREGMLASIGGAIALSPTSKYGTFTVANESSHGPQKDYGDAGAGARMIVSSRIGPKTQIGTGDRIKGVAGPVGVQYDDHVLLQSGFYDEVQRGSQAPAMWGDLDADGKVTQTDIAAIKQMVGQPASGPLDAADLNGDGKITATDATHAAKRMKLGTGAGGFTVATMNAENFFDPVDAPPPVDDDVPSRNEYNAKLARMAGAIRERLHFPDMVAMQEVENVEVLKDLVSRPEIKSMGYKYALLPTNGHRSINPALLYRGDRVEVTDVRQAQKQVSIKDAAGSSAMFNPDGTAADSGPLFSREPLIVDLTVKDGEKKADLTVIANHLISKFSPRGLPTEPIRIEQAKYLNGLVRDLRSAHPEREVLVVGDLNDTPDSKSLKALVGTAKSPVLKNVIADNVPKGEQYSYNYGGQNDLIDHILATPNLAKRVEAAGVHHFNADTPANARWGTAAQGATDHDPPYATFRFPEPATSQATAGAKAVAKAKATPRVGKPASRA